ncbi:MAG TPA: UDP-glucose 4-epimerase GalE [Candidatus Omnitrophota bacterium]|nr:UDP-glucose 4-epimerase GalE [Candidatus Omnitrophota bacterium]
MVNVLVTGGAGYVGSHTCKALAAAGFKPVVVDDLSTGHARAVRWGPLERLDLADGDGLRRIIGRHGIQAVLHFAASAYVGESMARPGKYFRNNVANSLSLVEAMVECGVRRVVFSSSCATYGLPVTLPIAEDHPQAPINPYGETKRVCERMLHWFGLDHVCLRYFNAAGADPDGEIGENHEPETHLLPLAIRAALGGPPLRVMGTDYPTPDGTAVRDYIHVADLADAHVRALVHLLDGGEPACLNLGTGQGHSVREVVAAVERRLGRTVPVEQAPRRPGDPPVLVADARRAADLLGWRARRGLDEMVEDAAGWALNPRRLAQHAGDLVLERRRQHRLGQEGADVQVLGAADGGGVGVGGQHDHRG